MTKLLGTAGLSLAGLSLAGLSLAGLSLAGLSLATLAAAVGGEIPAAPPGWELAGSRPHHYEVAIDPEGGRGGGSCLRLASVVGEPEGFSGVGRSLDPAPYRGRRLALAAHVRAEEVAGWGGLWLRIDGREQRRSLALDNMQERPIRGSHPWRRYQVVLDVPPEAVKIWYGAILSGAGRLWVDGFELTAVGSEVPTTALDSYELRFRGLDFEPLPPP